MDQLSETLRFQKPEILVLLETKVHGAVADDFSSHIPFDRMHRVDGNGRRGGIWLFWDPIHVRVDVVHESPKALHAIVQVMPSSFTWLLTAVYASPCRSIRNLLWDDLKLPNLTLPWLLAGDFNEIISQEDKMGGRPFNESKAQPLINFLNRFDLFDLGFVGSRFTWTNKRYLIFERIDKSFANGSWLDEFPHTSVLHLPRITSDHHPILINLAGNNSRRFFPSFKFESMWLRHHRSLPMLSEFASTMQNQEIPMLIPMLQDHISNWNKSSFGNIFRRKSSILHNIQVVQSKMYSHPSPNLFSQEWDLIQSYHKTLEEEKDYWHIRSNLDWSLYGDRNSKFFHNYVKHKRRRNSVNAIKDGNGNWITDSDQIANLFVQHFKTVFNLSPQSQVSNELLDVSNYNPSSNDFLSMADIPAVDEIKSALFSMGPLKAPGPDGFHPLFFQKTWNIFGTQITNFVQKVVTTGSIPQDLNKTNICLIPKCVGPSTVNHFRPISLCNKLYKLVSKIIVNRLQAAMPSLITPNQSSFVKGRRASDNYLVASELIHTIKKKRGKGAFCIAKLDLSKAYDKVSWEFVKHTLFKHNFPNHLIKLNLACISSVTFRITWQRRNTSFLHPNCGLRQGDPLSPYIFILCLNELSLALSQAESQKRIFPIKLGQKGLPISHLFFADDIILTSRVNSSGVCHLMELLSKFLSDSHLDLNLDKSQVMVSPNASREQKNQIRSFFGMSLVSNLGKYLGLPLPSSCLSRSHFQPVLDKMSAALSSWQSKLLSMAGRVVLTKAVLSSIPLYHLQSIPCPTGVAKSIDKLARNFIWGHDSNTRKWHAISWDQITVPKCEGGLGIRRTMDANLAFFMNTVWRIHDDPSSILAKMFKGKYFPLSSIWDTSAKTTDSAFWKFILKAANLVKHHSSWVVGNGERMFSGRTVGVVLNRYVPC